MREDVYRKMAEHVIEGLKKRNMEGIYCENGEEAARAVADMIGPGDLVSWGGSATISGLGILDLLRERGQGSWSTRKRRGKLREAPYSRRQPEPIIFLWVPMPSP